MGANKCLNEKLHNHNELMHALSILHSTEFFIPILQIHPIVDWD
jgi:hypothetical protein